MPHRSLSTRCLGDLLVGAPRNYQCQHLAFAGTDAAVGLPTLTRPSTGAGARPLLQRGQQLVDDLGEGERVAGGIGRREGGLASSGARAFP